MSAARNIELLGLSLMCAALGACSQGGSLATGALAEYKASNMLSPSGYEESLVSETQYRVVATGTDSTPYERVEKIAMARAADIGRSKRFAYFKVSGVTRDMRCRSKKSGNKTPGIGASSTPTVTLDAIYAQAPADPEYRSTEETFTRLQGELANETYAPEVMQAAASDAKARCGGGT